MKKLITLILFVIMVLCSLTACVDENPNDNLGGNGGVGGNGETGGYNGIINTPAATASNILIVYFSCTNTTETIAKHIETKIKGTVYEITPEVPYTEDDLKYYTNCRADKEQADSSARPAINGSVENIENYDIIFLGYPIWHGQAPRIISTFLESYDLSDKTIVPFCTSQSSGIGSSDTNLHSIAPSAKWLAGKRFSPATSKEVVAEWIDSLDLKLTPSESSEQPVQPYYPENDKISKMYITINGNKIEVTLAENSSADALVERLKQSDTTYLANDYGGFEKVGSLGFSLPTNNSQITTQPGDVILYSGNQIVIFYGNNSWSYTRLGKINGYTEGELRSLLLAGSDNIEVRLSLQ